MEDAGIGKISRSLELRGKDIPALGHPLLREKCVTLVDQHIRLSGR
jgi:hypothetical protein